MTVPKSNPQASPRVACYGTAFLADAPIDTTVLKRGIAPDVPQFNSPRLDTSFLANCGSLLNGKTATMDDPRAYFKRIAGTDFRSPKAIVLYECSSALRGLLAALTEDRAVEIAEKSYDLNQSPKTKPEEPNGRMQRRKAILNSLAVLAKQATVGHKKLMLRVEYRKQR